MSQVIKIDDLPKIIESAAFDARLDIELLLRSLSDNIHDRSHYIETKVGAFADGSAGMSAWSLHNAGFAGEVLQSFVKGVGNQDLLVQIHSPVPPAMDTYHVFLGNGFPDRLMAAAAGFALSQSKGRRWAKLVSLTDPPTVIDARRFIRS